MKSWKEILESANNQKNEAQKQPSKKEVERDFKQGWKNAERNGPFVEFRKRNTSVAHKLGVSKYYQYHKDGSVMKNKNFKNMKNPIDAKKMDKLAKIAS